MSDQFQCRGRNGPSACAFIMCYGFLLWFAMNTQRTTQDILKRLEAIEARVSIAVETSAR
jgi:hypothetical protein